MACLTVHERRDRTAGGGAARERHREGYWYCTFLRLIP